MPELISLHLQPNPRLAPPSTEHTGGPRIAFVTLGCKVNQSDTQEAIAGFRAAGFRIVPPSSPAEVYVVNTCSVTHIADRKSRQWLRRSARANPTALVVATGCYAESGRGELEAIDEVGMVVGYREKGNLLGLVLSRLPDYRPTAAPVAPVEPQPERLPSWAGADPADPAEGELEPEYRARTRAMVKIEDGCNDFCTFCIIPFTWGMPRSTSTNEVVRTVQARLAEGFQEIVLTGVHMGKYGQDHAQRKRSSLDPMEAPDLQGIVQAVLDRTSVPRLRITSVEPTDALSMLPLLADPQYAGRLAPHLHLPLQSGCDQTLARMKRDYKTAEYAEVVQECRDAVLNLSITTDLITGFPGETDEEWASTLDFVRSMDFAAVHVFPYSQRPGTPASSMPGHVSPPVRHARTLEMAAIGREAEAAFAVRNLGTTRPVLWERPSLDGLWSGLTDNYIRVYTRSPDDLQNVITQARLASLDARGVWAEPLQGER